MKIKRILCALLCLIMVLGVPFAASADPILGVEDNIFPPETDVVDIDTKAEFDAIREDTWGYYRLTADLTFTAADFADGGAFAGGFVPFPSFSGVLDGNGHNIVGLEIKGAGLFAENKGTVTDLQLVDAYVSYDDANVVESRVGGIAGGNFGTIMGCGFYGSIDAHIDASRLYLGGIAGLNSGSVKNCAVGAQIGADRYVDAQVYHGGLVGYNCYWGGTETQGKVLSSYANVVMNIYNDGNYTAKHLNGYVAGCNQNAVVEGCYYPDESGSAVGEESYTITTVEGHIKDCAAVGADKLSDAASFPKLDVDNVWEVTAEPELRIFPCVDTNGDRECEICGEKILLPAPGVATQPKNVTVTVGSDATFTVTATGEELSYQWYSRVEDTVALSDNANFSGTKTATLTVKTAGTAWCTGGYPHVFCRITNEGGSVDTAVVSVKVNHKAGSWNTVKEATTSSAGLKEQRCTACDKLLNSKTIAKLPSQETPKVNFTDVKKSDFFYDAVQWAVANGVTTGTGKTTFGPAQACTRAQAVTFLWRAAGQPAAKSTKNPFTDVKKSDYFYKAVLWAAESGVTSGVSKTSFAPNATCTRGQIVTFLWRAQGAKKVNSSNPFTDVKSKDFYYDAVLWAVKNNVTSGMSKTSFAPSAKCTRGQIVTFLYRAIVK